MLTKNDLDQIRKVVRQEVKVEVKDSTQTVEGQIRLSRMQVQTDINELDDRAKNIEIRQDDTVNKVDKIQKDIDGLSKKVSKIQKTQDTMLDMLDKEQMQQRKRIVRLEEEVGLPIPQ
jgi:hypothetical protein